MVQPICKCIVTIRWKCKGHYREIANSVAQISFAYGTEWKRREADYKIYCYIAFKFKNDPLVSGPKGFSAGLND